MIDTKNTHTHIDEMLQSQRQRTNNDLQNTIYRKHYIYIENKTLSNTNPTTNQLFTRLTQTYKKEIM
jgi:ABC-type long-subunit fatty acid transport system fused permease/ATPase subunit